MTQRGRRKPGAYQIARGLRGIATLGVVLLLLFVGASAYSAAQIRPVGLSNGGIVPHPASNDTVELQTNVSISNPGWFAIDRLLIESSVFAPGANHTLLSAGGSPVVRVASGSVGTVPLRYLLTLSGSEGLALLTHDATLPYLLWVNATYATLFDVRLELAQNLSWGAPFADLNASVSSPAPQNNGTALVTLTLSFDDHASFGLAGAIGFVILDRAGAECAQGSLPISVGSHGSYRGGANAYLPFGCDPRGGTIQSTFHGGGWNVPLPTEAIP